MTRRMIFDVESIGLHGEGFAVACAIFEGGNESESAWWSCPATNAMGLAGGLKWVVENVPPEVRVPEGEHALVWPREVRSAFWEVLDREREAGTELWADTPWPVEARFLADCSKQQTMSGDRLAYDEGRRYWKGPFPLLDVATVKALAARRPDCLPFASPDHNTHHPLDDCRASFAVLAYCFGILGVQL